MAVTDKATLKARLVNGYTLTGPDMTDIIDSYTDALTLTAAALYQATVLAESTLVSYFPMDEASASLLDRKGSNNLAKVGSPRYQANGPFPGISRGVAVQGGSYFQKTSPTSLPTGNSARTVEFWARPTASQTAAFFYGTWGSAQQAFGWTFNVSTDTHRIFTWSNDLDVGIVGINDGEWHHFAATWDGTTMKMYVDGVLVGSTTLSALNTVVDANGLMVGANVGLGGAGTMAHFAVYSSALSGAAIASHYAAGVSPTTQAVSAAGSTYQGTVLAEAGLVSYWKLDEASGATSWADAKGGNTMVVYGNSPSPGQAGALPLNGCRSVYFNGVDSEGLNCPSPSGIPVGNAARSVELWFKPGLITGNHDLVSWGSGASSECFLLRIPGAVNALSILSFGDGPSVSMPFSIGEWHHLVVTVPSGAGATTAGGVKVYLDGTLIASTQFGSQLNTVLDGNGVSLGRINFSSGAYYNGWLDEVAIYSTVLTAAQVADHYARGVQAGF